MTPPPRRCRLDRPDMERGVLFLPESSETARRSFTIKTPRIYRPFTILLWGSREDTWVWNVESASQERLISPSPGCLFEADVAYDEFLTTLVQRSDGMSTLSNMPAIGLCFPLSMSTLPIGDELRIDLQGPVAHGCFIGFTLAPERP